MPWDDLEGEIEELFGDFHTFSPNADRLSIIKHKEPKPLKGKTPEEMRAYKAAKMREYRERAIQVPPTEATKEILRRKALERKLMRERMPAERKGLTHHFTLITKTPDENGVREIDGYLTCNVYPDSGQLGEIFIRIGKSGAEEAIYEQWAIGASIALQFGVPVEAYFKKFLGTRFEPSGATSNKEIPRCTSILDYVSRFILKTYCKPTEEPALVSVPANAEIKP